MSAALGLLRLQQIDTFFDQLQEKLRHVRAQLADEAETEAARQVLEAAQMEHAAIESGRMQAEGQASSQRNRLHQAEAALYGPGSRSPKELQDLTADVAALKRYLVTLDAAEVSWMEKLEGAEEGVGRAKSALEAAQARSDAARPVLLAQERDLLREQEKLQAERAAAVGAVPAPLLDTYEGLRRMRRGVAVVEVLDGACGACGTSLTAALQQSARHAAVPVTCPNCGRFLFGG